MQLAAGFQHQLACQKGMRATCDKNQILLSETNHQDAFFTPGISPFRAFSLN